MVKGLNSYSQKFLCNVFKIVQENAHRAYGDVDDLNKVYNSIVTYGINHYKLNKDLLTNTDKLYGYIYTV